MSAKIIRRKKYTIPIIIIILLLNFNLTGCDYVNEKLTIIPTEDNTTTGVIALTEKINKAAKAGKEELTVFTHGVTREEVAGITENMGLFWGKPNEYTILKDDSGDGEMKIRFYIDKTNNYYAYHNYMNGTEIPEGNEEAKAIAVELAKIIKSTIKEGMSDYEKELAIHDWLVKNIQYDGSVSASSTDNGTYGALIKRGTMCRGYAESMSLISECIGLKTRLVVGKAKDGSGEVVGHAWNMVKLGDKWYQLDVTYDDPVGNPKSVIHYYYFNLNDESMKSDHFWQEDYFPKCENDSYMYYKKEGMYAKDIWEFQQKVSFAINNYQTKQIEIAVDVKKVTKFNLDFIFDTGYVNQVKWTTHGSKPTIVFIEPDYY